MHEAHYIPEFEGTHEEAHEEAYEEAARRARELSASGKTGVVSVFGPMRDDGSFPLKATSMIPPHELLGTRVYLTDEQGRPHEGVVIFAATSVTPSSSTPREDRIEVKLDEPL